MAMGPEGWVDGTKTESDIKLLLKSMSAYLCRDDGSVEVQLGVGFPIAGVDLERLRVEVEGRRPVGALEDRVALLFLLLQLLSLLVNVLGLLVVGRQPQDLECEEKVSNLRI